MIDVFWKSDLTDAEEKLISAVHIAHCRSVSRGNVSSQVVRTGAALGNPYHVTIASALLTLGGLHGPVTQTVDLLRRDDALVFVDVILQSGRKVPGWGNSFVSGSLDPIWVDVDSILEVNFTEIYSKILTITALLHSSGMDIYPNPACYTAATAIVTGVPDCAAGYLFVASRLSAWTAIYADLVSKSPVLA